MLTAEQQNLIHKLGLQPHPEGGYFARTHLGAQNTFSTAYFLLTQQDRSHWHSIQSEELLLFHVGTPLQVHIMDTKANSARLQTHILGSDILNGQSVQIHIPAHSILAMEPIADNPTPSHGYSLISCLVTPPFTFQQFRLWSYDELVESFPGVDKKILQKFSSK